MLFLTCAMFLFTKRTYLPPWFSNTVISYMCNISIHKKDLFTAMAFSKVSPLSSRLPTNSCVTGKWGGSFVHLMIESGLQPLRNWYPKKRSSFQYFAASGTSPTKPVNAYLNKCRIFTNISDCQISMKSLGT